MESRAQASSLPGAPASAIHFHDTLLQGIRARDSQRCRAVMREHLNDAEKFLGQMDDGETAPTKP